MKGRPLLFLAAVVGGWAGVRTLLLWPDLPPALRRPLELAVGAAAASPVPAAFPSVVAAPAGMPPASFAPIRLTSPRYVLAPARGQPNPDLALLAMVSFPRFATTPASEVGVDGATVAPAGLPEPHAGRAGSRWSGSAWLIVRDGGGNGGAIPSPLLGGSQAGVRVAYALDRDRRAAAFARLSAPLGDGPADLGAGVQWRPRGSPATLFAEGRRYQGGIAPAVGGFGGGTARLGDFRLEGYGQAGLIAHHGISGFGDGQVRLVRAAAHGDLGVGMWAAAQPGAGRVDIGPTLAVKVPVRQLNLRLTLDWRQRIAGTARPASGPALSLGADF